MEKISAKLIIVIVLVTIFYSCERRIAGCYFKKQIVGISTLELKDDSTFILNRPLKNTNDCGEEWSSGRYSIKGNKLILTSGFSEIKDSLLVHATKKDYSGFMKMRFMPIRRKFEGLSFLLKIEDNIIFTAPDSILLFDKNISASVLSEYKFFSAMNLFYKDGIEAYEVSKIPLKTIILFYNIGESPTYSLALDSSFNDFTIYFYNKLFDSLERYRYFKNEVWQLKGKRILDTKTNDEFVKTKKLPYRFREHDYTNPDVPDLLNYPEFNVRDSLGRKQGVWKTVPDSLPNFRYNTLRFKDVVDKRKYLANNDSTIGSITLYETYINDKLVGPFKGLYSNSSIAFRGEYRNNRVDGKYFEYSSNGEISFFANYNMGMLQGKCVEFGFFGVMEAEYTYENGILREEIIYECFGSKRDGFHNSVDEFLIPYINYIIKYDKKGRPYNGRVYAYDYQGKIERVFEYRKHKLYKEYSVIYDWEENCYEFVNEDRDYPWWWKH